MKARNKDETGGLTNDLTGGDQKRISGTSSGGEQVYSVSRSFK